MRSLKIIFSISIICILGSGCVTKVIQVSIPQPKESKPTKGYVKIESIKDLRNFQRAPKDPSIPSVEGDFIENKDITDKVIGRMRHGTFHYALWNFKLKKEKNIYEVCRKIVANSLKSAGYKVVTEGHDQYTHALPLAVEILQFWAWMQPHFNIDVHFDGELKVKSLNPEEIIDITANGSHMFSTSFAGESAWTEVVKEGVKKLDKDLVIKFKGKVKSK